jgi:hypothetical protein
LRALKIWKSYALIIEEIITLKAISLMGFEKKKTIRREALFEKTRKFGIDYTRIVTKFDALYNTLRMK